MAGWSSGWVNTDGTTAVANGVTLNFAHNLGSTDLILCIYAADDNSGTNTVAIGVGSDLGSSGVTMAGAQIQSVSSTQVTLQLGSSGYNTLNSTGQRVNGSETNYAGKFIKIVATAAISDPVPGTGDLCKILSEDSGYQMFRNGLTIQWVSSVPFTDQDQAQTVNFPIAFAADPLKVVCSTRNPDGNGNAGAIIIETTSSNKTSVTLMSQAEGDKPKPSRPYFADIIAIGIADVTDCPASGGGGGGGGGDVDGIKISQLTTAAELKDDDLFVISKENTGDGIYDISQKVALSEIATYIAGAEPPAPTPPPEGIVHFSSKIISNAASSTESKAFEDDDSSDITAAGVYEIQSTTAFTSELYNVQGSNYRKSALDPNRSGDGWSSSTGLGKAVPTVAKQDLKSMAIPAGTTVKFSLDWTHLGATYVAHQYTREDLVFFEITGPALIVDLSPGESLPDASNGTHLANMGITSGKVYTWYNILQYPEPVVAAQQTYDCGTIFNQNNGSPTAIADDVRTPAGAANVNSLYYNQGQNGSFQTILIADLLFFGYSHPIDTLFKLPSTVLGQPIADRRTLRNMPYTSTLIIE